MSLVIELSHGTEETTSYLFDYEVYTNGISAGGALNAALHFEISFLARCVFSQYTARAFTCAQTLFGGPFI
jgi:hypothetical protein